VSRCAYCLKSIRQTFGDCVSPPAWRSSARSPSGARCCTSCKVLHIVQHNFVQMECRQKMTPEVRPTFGNHHSFGSQYGDSFMYESAQMDECLSLRDHIAGCIRDAKHAFKIMEPASLSKRCSKQTRRVCFTLLLNEYGCEAGWQRSRHSYDYQIKRHLLWQDAVVLFCVWKIPQTSTPWTMGKGCVLASIASPNNAFVNVDTQNSR